MTRQSWLRWWYLLRFTESRRRCLRLKGLALRHEVNMWHAMALTREMPPSHEKDALLRVMHELVDVFRAPHQTPDTES